MLDRIKKLANKKLEELVGIVDPATDDDKGIQALSRAFVLLANADKVIEDEEVEMIADYLVDLPIVIEKGVIREVAEEFLSQIERVEKAKMTGAVESSIVLGELLNELSIVRGIEEWESVVRDTVTLVTSGGEADQGEIKTRNRILKVLGKT